MFLSTLISKIRRNNIVSKNNKLKFLNIPVIHDWFCLLFLTRSLCETENKKDTYDIFKNKIKLFIDRLNKKSFYFTKNNKIKQSLECISQNTIKIINK